WLSDHVLQGRHVLAVAGTHGKTTTTAILTWMLEHAGLKPGFLIGGVPQNFGVSARPGETDFFVIEADEYDTAFFDKSSKFVHYRPRTAILNNLEYDHADIFADLGAIETQFHHLVRTVPASGRLVVNGTEESLARVLARGCWSERELFGGQASDWQAANVGADDSFDVVLRGQMLGRVVTDLTGAHNRMNILAALAAARHVGVDPAAAIESLKTFKSVKRRLELRGTVRGVSVYDDFAHHPTAIDTTVAGLRKRIGAGERILAVLEPRSNTMKLGAMKAALPGSLQGADRIYGYGATEGKHALGWDLAAALAPLGDRAAAFSALDELVAAVVREARAGDHVLVMSNGGFGGVHDKLLKALNR
ncbi:MAG TPA: UDP-N-acetylmuramate:L-alanyl-gamma-D-glutamyl-meso-diaminopimelate ligase, partial [Burkholderiaceae bacterium]|nr:UDP-N-acetylmuramate:L-alanyl-gamma-D-glutamyl-meso-diaminopimelate ligase [Burkholderiaceae bacterium]